MLFLLSFVLACSLGTAQAQGRLVSPISRSRGVAFEKACSTGDCGKGICQGMRFEDNKKYAGHFAVGQVVEMMIEDNKLPGTSRVAIFDTKTERNLTANLDNYQTPTDKLGRRITIPDLNQQCTSPGQCVLVLTWDAESPSKKHISSCVDFSIVSNGPLIYTASDSSKNPQMPATSQGYSTGFDNYSQNTIPISQNTMPVAQDTIPSSQTTSQTSSNTTPMSQNTISVSQNPDALYQNTIPTPQIQSSTNPSSASFANMPIANDNYGSTTYDAPYSPTTEFASKQYSTDYQSAPQVKDNIFALKDVAAARNFRSLDANSYSEPQRLAVDRANTAGRRLQDDQTNRLQGYNTDYDRLQGDYNQNVNNNPTIEQQIAFRDQTRRMQRQLEDNRKFQVDYTQALGPANPNINDELKRQQDMERQLRATYEKTRNLQKKIDEKIKSMSEATALATKQVDTKTEPNSGQQKSTSSSDNSKDKKASNQQDKAMAKPSIEKSTAQTTQSKGADTKKAVDAGPGSGQQKSASSSDNTKDKKASDQQQQEKPVAKPGTAQTTPPHSADTNKVGDPLSTTAKPSTGSNESTNKGATNSKSTDKKEPTAEQKTAPSASDKKVDGQSTTSTPVKKPATDTTKTETSSKPARKVSTAAPAKKEDGVSNSKNSDQQKSSTTNPAKSASDNKTVEKVNANLPATPVKKEEAHSPDQSKDSNQAKPVVVKAQVATETKQVVKDNTPKAQASPASTTKVATNAAQAHTEAETAAIGKIPAKTVSDQGAAKTNKPNVAATVPSKPTASEHPAVVKAKRAIRFMS